MMAGGEPQELRASRLMEADSTKLNFHLAVSCSEHTVCGAVATRRQQHAVSKEAVGGGHCGGRGEDHL